jgi:predicted ATPase
MAADDSLAVPRYIQRRDPRGRPDRVMISSVKINGYRAFPDFEMSGLGRVNLLVGRNNTGKTSLLEILYLLASGGNPSALWNVLARRGEQVMPDPAGGRVQQAEASISHMFHGHEIGPGTEFSITTTNDKPARSARYRIDTVEAEQNPTLFAHFADEGPGRRLALLIGGQPDFKIPPIPLSKLGSIRVETLQQYINIRAPKVEAGTTQFVTTESLSVGQIFQLWNSVVLTPDEDRVIESLKILDERIERIAQVQIGAMQYVGGGYNFPTRGGFFVRLTKNENRLPIGSFGEGVWRMLALSVALARAKDSLLLIDEIDTGLHYTVMENMWRLVSEAAEKFNIQVFATTHSYDCIQSLSKICRDVETTESKITIQRIEAGRYRSIPFTEREIRIAAEREIEIR